MELVILILAVVLSLLLATAFLLGRYLSQRQYLREDISAVSRQHLDLFQGGHLNEAMVEATKAELRDLLERGEVAAVEASLRPGVDYVVRVRALTELGTETAGRILERQLQRNLTDDQIEQSWYWIDLANGLRILNRTESLPALLGCAERACEIPLGHLFAAETVCMLGFSGYLREEHQSPMGRAALRILHRALEGMRWGLPPQVVVESRLGELVETLWDHCDAIADPLVTRIFHEACRAVNRIPHIERLLQGDPPDLEAYHWQMARLSTLEVYLQEHLHQAPAQLRKRLPEASPSEQREILKALIDLRSEAGESVLTLLSQPGFQHEELAIELLTWSRSPHVSTWLRDRALNHVPMLKRAQRRRRAIPPRRPSVAEEVCYEAILHALRGHGSQATEALLLLASRDWDPTYRAIAVSSLGWWEPIQRQEVLLTLQDARRDPSPDVRQSARAALARLGERQALQWYRQSLASEDPHRAHETIQAIAAEGLTLLWPDLDRLADAEDPDIAHHARESLTRLGEALPSSEVQ